MVVEMETYRLVEDDVMRERDEVVAARRRQLCEDLGMTMQAAFVGEQSQDPGVFYEELIGKDLFVWAAFLPTFYSKVSGDWENYTFDVVPHEALEEIRTADSLELFDDLEIWTPQRRFEDPMVVGVLGRRRGNPSRDNLRVIDGARFFAIARWGESLMPLEEIRGTVLPPQVEDWESDTGRISSAVRKQLSQLLEGDARGEVTVYGRCRKGKRRKSEHCGERSMYRVNVELPGRADRRGSACGICGELYA